jgi:hypothetical protein
MRTLVAIALLSCVTLANAQTLLIRGATVHTVACKGVLNNTDVLIRDGKIAAVGSGLSAPRTPRRSMRRVARSHRSVRRPVGDRCRRVSLEPTTPIAGSILKRPAFEMQWRPSST